MIDQTQRFGLYAGLASYCFWGFAPLYFKLLIAVPAVEVIAHRVVWAMLLLLAFLCWRDRKSLLSKLRLPLRYLAMLTLTGTLVAGNWLVFVWAVNNGQVLATSLGYFINPLVSVALGMAFLGERLHGPQWVALFIAVAATLYLSFFVGEPPWIALALAAMFGLYGLLRKRLPVGPMIGMLWETMLLLPAALIYLFAFASPETALSTTTLWLLLGSGLVTLLPLIGFNYAAKRLTLTSMGFLQYLAPSISFLLAVFVYREPFDGQKLSVFIAIWVALAIFTWTSMQRARLPRASQPSH